MAHKENAIQIGIAHEIRITQIEEELTNRRGTNKYTNQWKVWGGGTNEKRAPSHRVITRTKTNRMMIYTYTCEDHVRQVAFI